MRKVKWGVLGVAKIAAEKVIPAMQRGERLRDRRHRLARPRQGARRPPERLGIPRAYGSYEELLADPEIEAIYNPLPNELHVPVDDQGARGRQARPVREADRARRGRGARADRGARPHGQAGRGSLHGALPSAMAARARAGRVGGDRREPARSRPSSPIACSIRTTCATVRRAAAGSTTSAATRSSRRATCSAPSRRGSSRPSTATRTSAPTGWPARSSNFPAAGI